jgi:hypothetical protein
MPGVAATASANIEIPSDSKFDIHPAGRSGTDVNRPATAQ